MRKKAGIKFLIVLLIILFGVSVYNIILWHIDNRKMNAIIEEISDTPIVEIVDSEETIYSEVINDEISGNPDYYDYVRMSLIDVDFTKLMKKNKDTVGWIQLEGTNINYPFVQAKNNSYYLTHSFDKSYNAGGWIFLDYRNSIKSLDKNTIIYGHGRQNNTMFGSLKNITKSNWYKDTLNHTVKISTPKENTLWQVFSVYIIPTESYYIQTEFDNNKDFLTFANTLLKRSVYDFKVKLTEKDYILTLSTCYNDYKKVVLHARLIKKETKS